MSFQQVSSFTDSAVADLLDSFGGLSPSLDTLFVCFLHQWTSWVLVSSAEVTLLLNLETHINTCVLCINCSPKATQHSKSFCSKCTQFQAKFVAGILFFQLCHFLGMPRPKMEFTYIWIVNKTVPNNHAIQPYSKQEMTSSLYLHPVLDFRFGSSSVISW
jgi:hypothetical protein